MATAGNPYNPGSKRLRFLMAGPLPPPELGQSVSFEMLCDALRARGHDCRIVDVKGKKASLLPSRITLARSLETLSPLAWFVGALLGNYRRVYITISQSRAGFLRDMVMIWSAWITRCRIVIHLKGGNYDGFYRQQPRCWRFLIRYTLRRVHRLIILSERLRDMYSFDPALTERIVVIPNSPPVEMEGYSRNLCLGREQPIRLTFLSNLIQSKGYYDVLEAAGILRRTTSIQFEVVFAGRFLSSIDDSVPMSSEEAKAKFLDRVKTNGLEDIVRYLGPVTGREKWQLLETSDFFLLPTNYIHEGQPVSIIEAMGHGCVVVATDFRAIPDMVVDGVTGRLVEHNRPDQIADAIRQIAAAPSEYATMSKATAERYRANFTLQRHLDAIIPLLEDGA